jgi:hypothetical protein
MRKAHLSLAILLLILASAAYAAKNAVARFTPPPETGMIYTVINFNRADGKNQATYVNVNWGDASRNAIVSAPGYASPCKTSTPAGFVFRLRHSTADVVPLTISTTGTIVRGPYQGEPPLELLHACYRLVKGG